MSSVPASLVLNTYDGDEFFVGSLIALTSVTLGGVVSIVKEGMVRVPVLFAASVTLIDISEYVPSFNLSNVMVCAPDEMSTLDDVPYVFESYIYDRSV